MSTHLAARSWRRQFASSLPPWPASTMVSQRAASWPGQTPLAQPVRCLMPACRASAARTRRSWLPHTRTALVVRRLKWCTAHTRLDSILRASRTRHCLHWAHLGTSSVIAAGVARQSKPMERHVEDLPSPWCSASSPRAAHTVLRPAPGARLRPGGAR